jgi:SAM-dependent methyltransferase
MHDSAYLAEFARDGYLRERLFPRRGDPYYLHLSDLLLALSRHSTQDRIRVLDFGCGGSPYRSLFPNADYRRADVHGVQDIDFVIDETGHTDAPSDAFDLVLSTQVLEHCRIPKIYLRECHRVLRESGKLLLTTHGSFEDHGSPYDFRRWTADGLGDLLAQCSFAAESVTRLTMGPRAGFLLLQSTISQMNAENCSRMAKILWWPVRRLLLARRRVWDPLLDRTFPEYRVSGSHRMPGDNLYIDLLAAASPIKAQADK